MDWHNSVPSTVTAPTRADPQFLVLDADTPSEPRLARTVEILGPPVRHQCG